MNNFKDKTALIIYNGSNAEYQDYTGAAIGAALCDYACTYIDVDGTDDTISTDDEIYDQIAALVAAETTYDRILVTCAISDEGGSETISYATVSLLRSLLADSALAGTYVESGTAASGGADYIQLKATASSTDDYYNSLFVVTTGGTGEGQTQFVLDYDAAGGSPDKKCLIGGGDWDTNPDNTTTYEIYDETNIIIAQDPALTSATTNYRYDANAVTYGDAYYVWATITKSADGTYSNNPPLLVRYLADTSFYEYVGSATSGAATTITNSAGTWTTNELAGMYIFISTDTAAGEWAQIASNTDTVITCRYFNNPDYAKNPTGGNAAWTTNPASGSDYFIVDGFGKILKNCYAQTAVKLLLSDIESASVQKLWKRLIDNDGKIYQRNYGEPYQDIVLLNQMLERGKDIYDGVNIGITVADPVGI